MDPNEALKNARAALKSFRAAEESDDSDESHSQALIDAGEDLASAFEALDEWLMKGGFLPEWWAKAAQERNASRYTNSTRDEDYPHDSYDMEPADDRGGFRPAD